MIKHIRNLLLIIGVIGIANNTIVECRGAESDVAYNIEEQYSMDLPDETPGLIDADNTGFVKVLISDYREPIILKSTQQEPQSIISFPKDAHQPTTEDAVKWACANTDNTENSPITTWYMKMFGVIPYKNEDNPYGNDYIKAGYDENNNSTRIISYDATITDNLDDAIQSQTNDKIYITKRKFFIDNFRKIASTSVGRVLLYRLLIEIRRKDKNQNGCFETKKINEENEIFQPDRSILRSLSVNYGGMIAFAFADAYISIDNSFTNSSVIGIPDTKNWYTNILYGHTSNLDINLFHELGHWFHYLRNYARVTKEKGYTIICDKNICPYLWGGLEGNNNKDRIDNSSYCWGNHEEMRNILGSHINYDNEYLAGDDLCENLYRVCVNKPLRFGHTGSGMMGGNFFEDITVINKIIFITMGNMSKYSWKFLLIAPNIDNNEYNKYDDCANQGLGAFRMKGWSNPTRDKQVSRHLCCFL